MRVLERLKDRWLPDSQRDAEIATYSLSESSEEIERSSRETARAVCTLFERIEPVHALNLGCGYGRVDLYIAPHVRHLTLVDISDTMLDLARRRLERFDNVEFVRTDGESLQGVRDGSIDVLYSMFVLQHMSKELAFRYMIEMNRVLRLDGTVLLQFPTLRSRVYLEDFVFNAVFREDESNPARVRCYSLDEVGWILDRAGFDITEAFEDRDRRFFSENEIAVIGRKVRDVSLIELQEQARAYRKALHRGTE